VSPEVSPEDIVSKLYVLAQVASISVAGLDKKQVADIAREAAAEIQRLQAARRVACQAPAGPRGWREPEPY
jgi:hypothetical protein